MFPQVALATHLSRTLLTRLSLPTRGCVRVWTQDVPVSSAPECPAVSQILSSNSYHRQRVFVHDDAAVDALPVEHQPRRTRAPRHSPSLPRVPAAPLAAAAAAMASAGAAGTGAVTSFVMDGAACVDAAPARGAPATDASVLPSAVAQRCAFAPLAPPLSPSPTPALLAPALICAPCPSLHRAHRESCCAMWKGRYPRLSSSLKRYQTHVSQKRHTADPKLRAIFALPEDKKIASSTVPVPRSAPADLLVPSLARFCSNCSTTAAFTSRRYCVPSSNGMRDASFAISSLLSSESIESCESIEQTALESEALRPHHWKLCMVAFRTTPGS